METFQDKKMNSKILIGIISIITLIVLSGCTQFVDQNLPEKVKNFCSNKSTSSTIYKCQTNEVGITYKWVQEPGIERYLSWEGNELALCINFNVYSNSNGTDWNTSSQSVCNNIEINTKCETVIC